MAAPVVTALPADVEYALGALEGMLPVWQATLREPEAFWPQFAALSAQVLAAAGDENERAAVRLRLEAMLAAQGLVRPAP